MNSKPARFWHHAVLIWGLCAGAVFADERILSFESNITIHEDASLTVRETIEVQAEGREIRRGIYRDFPTRYTDRSGRRVTVGFEFEGARRDGAPETWRSEKRGNGVRVYLGRAEVFLPPGVYRYELRYRTTRQLGFFADHDELYWNVTGNGWTFPMEQVRAIVRLPGGVSADRIRTDAYTGPAGATGKDFTSAVLSDGTARFDTTRRLAPAEGLTIAVGFPKGFVRAPTTGDRVTGFLHDNRGLVAGMLGVLLMLGYYLAVWFRIGRDPESGVVVPLFTPPEKLSAAALRFIERMGYDHTVLAAALLDLAARGAIEIRQYGKEYEITRRTGALKEPAPADEQRLLDHLLQGNDSFAFRQANHSTVSHAVEALKKSLKRQFQLRYFRTNGTYLIPGILIGALTLILAGVPQAEEPQAFLTLLAFLAGWSFAVVLLIRRRHYFQAVFFSLFEIAAFYTLALTTSWGLSAIALVMLAGTLAFRYLLRAPTVPGRRLMDAIEGFRLYLGVAEKERLNMLHPPELTPQLFEKYLPYALALGVEQEWSERFAEFLARQTQEPARPAGNYRPSWYHGNDVSDFSTARFASGLSGAIAASATAPGSSSGLGGGGSSGGGGGGGGGGGW